MAQWIPVTYDSTGVTASSSNGVLSQCVALFNNVMTTPYPNNAPPNTPAPKFLALLDTGAVPTAKNHHTEADGNDYPVFYVYAWSQGDPINNPPSIELTLAFYKSIRRSIPNVTTANGSLVQQRWWSITVGSALAVAAAAPDYYPPVRAKCQDFWEKAVPKVAGKRHQLVILDDASRQPVLTQQPDLVLAKMLLDPTVFKQPLYPQPPYKEPAYAAMGAYLGANKFLTGWEIVDFIHQ